MENRIVVATLTAKRSGLTSDKPFKKEFPFYTPDDFDTHAEAILEAANRTLYVKYQEDIRRSAEVKLGLTEKTASGSTVDSEAESL